MAQRRHQDFKVIQRVGRFNFQAVTAENQEVDFSEFARGDLRAERAASCADDLVVDPTISSGVERNDKIKGAPQRPSSS